MCGSAVCNCDAEFLNDLTVLLVDILKGLLSKKAFSEDFSVKTQEKIGDPTLDPWELYPFSDYDKSECTKTPAAQRRAKDCRK